MTLFLSRHACQEDIVSEKKKKKKQGIKPKQESKKMLDIFERLKHKNAVTKTTTTRIQIKERNVETKRKKSLVLLVVLILGLL